MSLRKRIHAQAWATALRRYGAELSADLRTRSFFETEYATVVLPNQVTTREEYLKARRAGRCVSHNRTRRNAVWAVIEAYRAAAAADGTLDFEEKGRRRAPTGWALPRSGAHGAGHRSCRDLRRRTRSAVYAGATGCPGRSGADDGDGDGENAQGLTTLTAALARDVGANGTFLELSGALLFLAAASAVAGLLFSWTPAGE